MNTILISAKQGHAIKDQEQKKNYFRERFQFLMKYRQIFESMIEEPWFLDDGILRDDPAHAVEHLVQYLVMQCETIIYREGGDIVFMAVFIVNRPKAAEFIGWINPNYRKGGYRIGRLITEFWNDEVLDYIWNDLKLNKFETRCCTQNRRALNFALKAGFIPVGELRRDFQINGELFDTFLFEVLNPALDIPLQELTENDQQREIEFEPVSDGDGAERPSATGDSDSGPVGVQLDTAVEHDVKYPSGDSPYKLHSSFRTKRYAVG